MTDQNSDQPLSLVRAQPMEIERSAPGVGDMLKAVIEKGISPENVSSLEKLIGLYERCQDRDAEKAYAQAFTALQSEMKGVRAHKVVPDKQNNVKYKFAPYEEIMKQVKPLLEKHGFTARFSTEFGEGRLIKSCILQHIGGHSKTTKFAVIVGGGPPGASQTQADGAASTYAKRFALCDALNIVIETDQDGRVEGGTITPKQADELRTRLRNIEGDEVKFLKFAHADKFETISDANLPLLEDFLVQKERVYMQKLGGQQK